MRTFKVKIKDYVILTIVTNYNYNSFKGEEIMRYTSSLSLLLLMAILELIFTLKGSNYLSLITQSNSLMAINNIIAKLFILALTEIDLSLTVYR